MPAALMLANGLAVFGLGAYTATAGGPGAGFLLGLVGFFMVVAGLDGLAPRQDKPRPPPD